MRVSKQKIDVPAGQNAINIAPILWYNLGE
jgi:hypothetical protein